VGQQGGQHASGEDGLAEDFKSGLVYQALLQLDGGEPVSGTDLEDLL
jgi:hypothetical protein